MNKKINIMQVFQYEDRFSVFHGIIFKNSCLCIKFWNELLEKDIDAVKMHDLGI